tara:strand:+ start:87 stop:1721 length:1635 start_codon:yes stop_codon:yes gene_type:complete
MQKLLLLINTLRYLKWQQIYFRLVRTLIKPSVTESFTGSILERSSTWEHIDIYENKINHDLEACFLNHRKKLDLPADWNNENPSKLWTYNLNYFEDLLSTDSKKKHNLHTHLLNSWVDHNPVGIGNGWEPYPSSLRIVNVLKAWLGGLELDKKLINSVFNQSIYLSNCLEKHLLGNHYFANLKALLFAGLIFKNTRLLGIAEEGLISQIPEQILEDGANFELSPMYHSIMLVDMLDIFNLNKAYPNILSKELVTSLEKYIPKMLMFMEAMAHPDGGVSFFNDSANGIAPKNSTIKSYAEKLGFSIKIFDSSRTQIIDNANSGYICATTNGDKIIFDAAAVGPNYIPGHAHADTLSFELSIGSQRVLVNSGTSEYGLSENRLNQRKTALHNTVEVDDKDSSQVWSSFRVANRSEIIFKNAKIEDGRNIELIAAHNGYKSLFAGCIHERKLTFSKNNLVVFDSLKRKFKFAKSRFYIHPNLDVSLEDDCLIIKGARFVLNCNLKGKLFLLKDSFYYPEFGLRVPNKMLELQFEKNNLGITFSWSKK